MERRYGGSHKTWCAKCKSMVGTGRFARHHEICDGSGVKSRTPSIRTVPGDNECPECGLVFSQSAIGTHYWRVHGEGKKHKLGGVKRTCPICQEEVGLTAIKRHQATCDGRGPKRYTPNAFDRIDGKTQCPHCPRMFAPLGLSAHIRWVHEGKRLRRSASSWNAGLSAKSDPRLAALGKKVSAKTKEGKTARHKASREDIAEHEGGTFTRKGA
jgi:hypothetical protein